ncbi:PepSY domain-containing protein [Methylonatrum kenyense]|uniref:PepSY domain-containing protein n=1 Tax=Methylonatrum kenyense TaxID=455253 RepID=UPI0020BE26FA|nr:PepSY domain-containing protein [Methylonatrum kenyense]MCK8517141.1 PepSY domain-containing protein [Methylonatrum kenyense]
MYKAFTTVIGVATLLTGAAIAQTDIGDLTNDDTVTIRGEVTSVWGNDFVLRDDSADILVEAGPTWYHEIGIEAGETLEVTGQQHGERFSAFTIERPNGQLIRVRPESGQAPWAGRREAAPTEDAAEAAPAPPAEAGRTPGAEAPEQAPAATPQHSYGMSREDVERALSIALDYGFVTFDEVEYEGDGIIEVEGWLEDGWEAEIEIHISSGEIVKEKRERSSSGPGLSADQILQSMDVAAAEGMVRFDEIEKDGSNEIEVEGWDASGREMEIDMDAQTFRILKIDID